MRKYLAFDNPLYESCERGEQVVIIVSNEISTAKPCQYFLSFLTKMRESCIDCALRISMLAKYIEIPEFCYDMDNLITFQRKLLCMSFTRTAYFHLPYCTVTLFSPLYCYY